MFRFLLATESAPGGLCLAWSETSMTESLATRLTFMTIVDGWLVD